VRASVKRASLINAKTGKNGKVIDAVLVILDSICHE
jgi:hypothetical protein